MNIFELPPLQIVKLFVDYVKSKLAWLSIGFAIISIAVLAVAFMLPKTYTSYTTILADKEGILSPLMKGTAVTTTTGGRANEKIALYREMLFGAEIMQPVIINSGWVNDDATDVDRARAISDLIENIDVSSAGPNLVRISVEDSDALRAFRTAKLLGELFIEQSLEDKQTESRAAYEFVDSQVNDYHQKLLLAEQKLKVYKTKNMGNQIGNEGAVFARINALRGQIEELSLQTQEERIRERSLQSQLAGEKQVDSSVHRNSGLHARISALEQQLATLRLDYHDTYPDIVRLKNQLVDLREMLNSGTGGGEAFSSDAVALGGGGLNTVFGALRDQLVQTRTNIAALGTRLSQSRRLLELELERAKKLPEAEAELAELTRDYEVTNGVYEDLVKRRENARVSMNIDIEQSAQRFGIQEPALLPLEATGIRFAQVAAAGPVVGFGAPLVALFALFQLGTNVRHKSQIIKHMDVRLLGEVPRASMPKSPKIPTRSAFFTMIACLVLVANAYIFAVIFKLGELGVSMPLS